MSKRHKPETRRCSMCDEWYNPDNAESVRIHEHPEPQSGEPREAWRKSGLPYERWIVETPEGKEWTEYGAKKLRPSFHAWLCDMEQLRDTANPEPQNYGGATLGALSLALRIIRKWDEMAMLGAGREQLLNVATEIINGKE